MWYLTNKKQGALCIWTHKCRPDQSLSFWAMSSPNPTSPTNNEPMCAACIADWSLVKVSSNIQISFYFDICQQNQLIFWWKKNTGRFEQPWVSLLCDNLLILKWFILLIWTADPFSLCQVHLGCPFHLFAVPVRSNSRKPFARLHACWCKHSLQQVLENEDQVGGHPSCITRDWHGILDVTLDAYEADKLCD